MTVTVTFTEVRILVPWFFPVAAFLFGAIVGSFLNVCIHRIPAGQSIVRPGSHCACGALIAWYDNIPIFSWLLLRGRARCCGRPRLRQLASSPWWTRIGTTVTPGGADGAGPFMAGS